MNDLIDIYRELKNLQRDLLFYLVAKHLTHRNVSIELRRPALINCRGFAFRSGDMGIIHVDPDLDDHQQLMTFLHECSHLRNHWDVLTQNPIYKGDPDTVKWVNKERHDRIWNAPAREDQASVQARQWLEYAEQQRPGGSTIELLQALLGMSF